MSKHKRLVYGVGTNDADYITQVWEDLGYVGQKRKRKLVWTCPYYSRWKHMLHRCYSEKYHAKHNYKDCTVAEDWLLFSNFRKWMVEQEWRGLQLDKDILILGNKVYSSETCVFVTSKTNSFMLESGKARGEWLIGVCWKELNKKFQASCKNPFTDKKEYLGLFDCQYEAHKAWLSKKLEHAYALAAMQTDQRVAKALIERYENYVPDVAVKEKGV